MRRAERLHGKMDKSGVAQQLVLQPPGDGRLIGNVSMCCVRSVLEHRFVAQVGITGRLSG